MLDGMTVAWRLPYTLVTMVSVTVTVVEGLVRVVKTLWTMVY